MLSLRLVLLSEILVLFKRKQTIKLVSTFYITNYFNCKNDTSNTVSDSMGYELSNSISIYSTRKFNVKPHFVQEVRFLKSNM